MKMLSYTIDISASAERVSTVMLGKETYREWAAEFNPGSFYEGGWNKGDKILFVGINDEGKREGMVAEIIDHVPNRLVSIRHRGVVVADREITEGPEVEGWSGAMENYTFNENNGITTIMVNVDTKEEFVDYFNEAWPKALNKLKEMAEKK